MTQFPSVIILLGPPGSGKGTQAIRLTKELSIPHISTGDLFRENIALNTDLGIKAKEYINAGNLVPDELVLNMLFDRVSRTDCINGYLLDGFPRTLNQAKIFQSRLNHHLSVLNLNVNDEAIVKRISGRLLCKQCSNIQNLFMNPPNQKGICDQCGGDLYQRPDDSASVVQERLRVYQVQTKPLIEFFENQGLLHHIDGENNPDHVFLDLKNCLAN